MEVAAAAVATPAIMWSSIRNAALEIHTDIPRPRELRPRSRRRTDDQAAARRVMRRNWTNFSKSC